MDKPTPLNSKEAGTIIAHTSLPTLSTQSLIASIPPCLHCPSPHPRRAASLDPRAGVSNASLLARANVARMTNVENLRLRDFCDNEVGYVTFSCMFARDKNVEDQSSFNAMYVTRGNLVR